MVVVNCAALPANLVESELFGREKERSPARMPRRLGVSSWHTAERSLDEVGELPLELQPKLLRVLQEVRSSDLGSPRTVDVDVRIIAATNRDLGEEVQSGPLPAGPLLSLERVSDHDSFAP